MTCNKGDAFIRESLISKKPSTPAEDLANACIGLARYIQQTPLQNIDLKTTKQLADVVTSSSLLARYKASGCCLPALLRYMDALDVLENVNLPDEPFATIVHATHERPCTECNGVGTVWSLGSRGQRCVICSACLGVGELVMS